MKPTTVGDFLIIIPTHNESAAITATLKVLYAHLQRHSFWKKHSYNVLVADNGSSDGTAAVAESTLTTYPHLIVTHTDRSGRGNVLKESFQNFSARYYIYLDCDLPVDLNHLDEMAKLLQKEGIGAVAAARLPVRRPLVRRLLTRCLNWFNLIFLGLRFHDAQAGFKGFTAPAATLIVERCHDPHFFFDSEALFWLQKEGIGIVELPVEWIDQRFTARKSSVKVMRDILIMGKQGLSISLHHHQKLWKTLVALFIVVASGAIIFTNHDPDLGWHLRAGELILRQGAVPWHDIFLYTVPGHRWIDHEWLVDVWLWLMWKNHLWIAVRAIFTVMATLPFLVWIRRSPTPLGWLYILAASSIAASTMGVRVQAIGYFLLWILLEILFGPHRIRSPKPALAASTVLLFFWANLHGSFPAGLFVVYVYAVTQRMTLAGIILPTLATLLTPYGIDLYKEVWELTVSRENHLYVQEWKSMLSHPHSLDLTVAILFMLGLPYALKKRPALSLITLAFFVSYVGTLRSAQLFAVASLFVVPYGLAQFEQLVTSVHRRHPFTRQQLSLLLGCYLLLAAQIILVGGGTDVTIISYNTAHYQQSNDTLAALTELRRCGPVTLFNDYTLGGTLINAFPDQPLFIDGRGPAWHYPDGRSLMQNFIDIVQAKEPDWHTAFDRYHINTAVLDPSQHQLLIKQLRVHGWYTFDSNPSFEILTKERHNKDCS